MLQKTRGIVLRSTEYGETSLIVRVYTELFGIQSYIVNSVRKKHAAIHSNIFQPLTPIALVAYHKNRPGIQRMADVRPNPALVNIPFDMQKSSMIFFLDEVLLKSVHEEEANPQLFEFISNAIVWLDESHRAGNDFHLIFLLKLTQFLGFAPSRNYNEERNIFNLREGIFQDELPTHPNSISGNQSKYFSELINAGYSSALGYSSDERRALIETILEYFELHIEGFGNIKSHKVLEVVWED